MKNHRIIILLLLLGVYFSCHAQEKKEIYIEFLPNDSTIYKKRDIYYIHFLYFKKDKNIPPIESIHSKKIANKTISVERLRKNRVGEPLSEYYKKFDYWIIEREKDDSEKLIKVILEGYIISDDTIED